MQEKNRRPWVRSRCLVAVNSSLFALMSFLFVGALPVTGCSESASNPGAVRLGGVRALAVTTPRSAPGVYVLLKRTASGYRFTDMSFSKPSTNAAPWVDLLSGEPVFFTSLEQNCAVGNAIGKVNIRASRCQTLVPELFRAEQKTGSQKLTNSLGIVTTLGMSGSLRMTNVGFDSGAYEKAFREAESRLGIPRGKLVQEIREADMEAASLIDSFNAVRQTTIELPKLRRVSDLPGLTVPEESSAEFIMASIQDRLLTPLGNSVIKVQEMEKQRAVVLAQFPAPEVAVHEESTKDAKTWALSSVDARAEGGDPYAQTEYGRRLWIGEALREDDEQAVAWTTRAAKQGNVQAQARLGRMYVDGVGSLAKDESIGEFLLRRAAIAGDAYGQWYLGHLYSDVGSILPRDNSQAVSWWRRAADQGFASAQADLGYCYFKGEGIARNYEQALEWLRKASDQGDPNGQNNLGVMYMNGEGVPRDIAQAKVWLEKAAAQGNDLAKRNLAAIARDEALHERPHNSSGRDDSSVAARALEWQRRVAACQSSCPSQCPPTNMYDGTPNFGCVNACQARCGSTGGY